MAYGNRGDAADTGWTLSAAARARLARPAPPPVRPPPITDHDAVARWRSEVHDAWLEGDPSPEACGHRPDVVGGVPVLRAQARAVATGQAPGPAPVVVYAHGGGYALGSPSTALPITDRLAARCEVVSVDYRLAPESPYPAAVDDVTTVVTATLATTAPGRPVILGGDSAGANLVVAVAQRLRSPASPTAHRPLDGLVLLSPHLDHGDHGRRSAAQDRDPRSDVDAEAARWLTAAYCARREVTDPLVSPLRGELADLPPTLLQAGSADSSLDHAVRFARRARSTGVDVTLDVWPDLWHTWQYHRDLPEADQALADVVDFCCALRVRTQR